MGAKAETHFALVLHDVTPETWPDYQPFVEALDRRYGIPIVWLVVPDFHHRNPLQAHPAFCRMLSARQARGDELVLHGYFHCDDEPAPRTPWQWFMRRVYTWEGEFLPLPYSEARRRLQQGIELFARLGWQLHGFVAPAWLLGQASREALQSMPIGYTSSPGQLWRLPQGQAISAPGLVWSAGSAWRRLLSRVFCEYQLRRHHGASLIRLGLHPVDMRHARSRNYWLDLPGRLQSQGRKAITKRDWLQLKGPT